MLLKLFYFGANVTICSMKKVVVLFFKFFVAILGLAIAYVLAAGILPLFAVNAGKISEPEVEIFILTNGVHTDIVCPVVSDQMDWSNLVPFDDVKANRPFKYLAFGWGDKGFYLDTPEWKDLKFSTAFNAAFWRGDSAMHTTFYNTMNEDDSCKRILISRADYAKLITYLQHSFEYDANGKVKLIETDAVYGTTDAFYEANGSYSLFYSCNTWASAALKVANQKAPLWTVTQQGIFRHYK